MKRILVVDDEPQIRRMLRASLQSSGYEVELAGDGEEGFELFARAEPDLVLTDLAMPRMSGTDLTEAIRRSSQVPIIVLSVRDGDAMKVHALDLGADDYLTKPFSMPELLARVRVQLRKHETAEQPERIEAGDFVIDTAARIVLVRGTPVHLTPKEFDLLLFLAQAPGRVHTHKALLRAVWGSAGDNQPEYLRVLVASLRRKIERGDGSFRYVQSEPWIGYSFHPSPDRQAEAT